MLELEELRKCDTYNETKGEKGAALDDFGSPVTAVVALEVLALVALNVAAKGVFATGKEEEHGVAR